MGYTPENNPYIPGDPYSYDLKWMVKDIKHMEERFGELDSQVQEATDQADRSEHEADRAVEEADRSRDEADRADREALVSEGYAKGTQDGEAVTEGPYFENNSKYYSEQSEASAQASADSAADAADYAAHIADPVSGLVASWLAAHVDPDTGYVIDDTFTIRLAAADAKLTGDRFNILELMQHVTYWNHFDNTSADNNFEYELAVNGNMLSNTNQPKHLTTHKIPVKAGTTYYIVRDAYNIGLNRIINYADDSPLTSSSTGSPETYTTIPIGWKFTASADGYAAFDFYRINAADASWFALYISDICDGNYHAYNVIGWEPTFKNPALVKGSLIDPDYVKQRWIVNISNGNMIDSGSPDYYTSGMIPIKNGKTYGIKRYDAAATFSGCYCIYDTDFSYVSGANLSGQLIFTAAADGYIKLSIVGTGGTNIYRSSFRCFDDKASDSLNYNFADQFVSDSALVNNKPYGYNNQIFTSYGDSLVANNNWQQAIAARFGMYHVAAGVGGSRVSGSGADAMWQDARISTINANSRLIMIHGGTNDDIPGLNIGSLEAIGAAHDTDTFIGAYQTMLEKIAVQAPNARVILLQPFYNSSEEDTINSSLETIRNAIRQVAELYGLPVYESRRNMGFNKLNQATYYVADPGPFYVHVNAQGGKRVSDCLIPFVMQYQIATENA